MLERDIIVDFKAFGIRIPAEVHGVHAQGKPRLRKFESNNRTKLHLPQLVMAVAGLPEPARSYQGETVEFPLENKSFVMDEMVFDIIEDDGLVAVLDPLRVSIRRSDFQVQLGDRLQSIAQDIANLPLIEEYSPPLAKAVAAHEGEIEKEINSVAIRKTADRMLALKSKLFGQTNAGSATTLIEVDDKSEVVEEEGITGKEGRLLVRLHVYKERDRRLAQRVRTYHRKRNGGRLICEVCASVPVTVYGPKGERSMEAHHKVPIEELQPDSITVVGDMAMVCANCHRVIHSQKPCLTISEMKELITSV